jgi:penicillin-binding protein 1A
MEKYGYITAAEAEEARNEQIQLRTAEETHEAGIAPHYVEYVRRQLALRAEKYGFDMYRDGISVYTSIDSRMQRYANRAIEEHLAIYQKLFDSQWDWSKEKDALTRVIDQSIRTSAEYQAAENEKQQDSVYAALKNNRAWVDSMKQAAKTIEVGFIAIDPKTGNILALVGGRNNKTFKYGLNHVTQIHRQPGSAFKPFVYTVAIDNGYSPCFEILNQPVTIMMADGTRWTPSNADGDFGGKMTIREAI